MIIDLRSDTVTRPTASMRECMAAADVGDDVYGEDPSVNHLETLSAEITGKESALFTTSGTQGNLLALLAWCGRGEEFIAGQNSHIYHDEGGGAAVLGGIQPQPLDCDDEGVIPLETIADSIKPDDYHYAMTRLLCLENTCNGHRMSPQYVTEACDLAKSRGLSTHLDGARLFNASISGDVSAAEIASEFDSVSFCLSKGLGTPAGSMLCGPRDLVNKARRWRKMLGGGLRQAGILAAAGTYALENNVDRLREDHANARELADRLRSVEGLNVDYRNNQTNMVFLHFDHVPTLLAEHLGKHQIIVRPSKSMRLVTHLDFHAEHIELVVSAFQTFMNGNHVVMRETGTD